MKCRICGANLKNGEDICDNCNKNIEQSKDSKETLVIKRKYSIKYELMRYGYIYLIFILSGIITETAGGMITCLILMGLAVCALLIWNKRISKATICKFHEKKIEFRCKFWIINNERTITYKNLDSIRTEQNLLQKVFNFGNVYIYAKKGNLITTGIQIINISNFKENLEKINAICDEKKID